MKFLDQRRLQCKMSTMTFGDNKDGDRFATFTLQSEISSKDKNLTKAITEEVEAMERNTTIAGAKISEDIPSQNISFFSTPDQKRASEDFTGVDVESIRLTRPKHGWPDGSAKSLPKVLLQFSFTLPFEHVNAQWAFRAYRSTCFVEFGECQQELPIDGKKKAEKPESVEEEE